MHVYKNVCNVTSSWAETGRDECPSRNTTSTPLPSNAQKILGRGNRKSVSFRRKRETREKSYQISRAWHSSPAWSHSSGSRLYWAWKMKLSTVNLTQSWRGHQPYSSRAAAVFSCVLNGEPNQAPTDSSKCIVTQKALIKITGSQNREA